MDTPLKYIQIVKDVLIESTQSDYAEGQELKDEVVFDDERKHYLSITTGRDNGRPFYEIMIAIRISPEGKVVIDKCNTDEDITGFLIAGGISKNDIE
jgi:hypothetical protein